MNLSVLTVPLYDRSMEEAFAWLSARGVDSLELGTGGFPGNTHCNPVELLADEKKLEQFKNLLEKYHLKISALSCHSNHVHPDRNVREKAAKEFTDTLRLAQKLGVDRIVTFSGCPGDCETAKYPNWVTYPWPSDSEEVLEYQWNEVLIPFWKKAAEEAAGYGVTKIALELHPGFCVYNPYTLLKLREAVGPAIGANFDPSHLFWQGIDPAQAIRALKGAIYHFHAKDTYLDPVRVQTHGVLDIQNLGEVEKRSWRFCTVGYGHDEKQWKEMMGALRLAGYDDAVSIEHEDALMSAEEGLGKAIEFLKPLIIKEQPIDAFWT